MRSLNFYILPFILLFTTFSVAQETKIEWPNGARAAICLTYDDAIDTHLDVAIPDLNRHGFKGTFYLQGDNISVNRLEEWRLAAMKGHELGNHTAFHPCSEELDFITPEYAAENYTVDRILRELEVMNTLLYAIDGKEERTYAYTCGQTEFGGVSIIDSLRQSGLFVAARGSGRGMVSDFRKVDLFDFPSGGKTGGTGQEHIQMAESAHDDGGIFVFTFHGVGGDYLTISREDHEKLLTYLDKNRDTYWVAPFKEVMKYVKGEIR